ncbi:MAG TPA: D-cysteine desulfhydrase family protein [Pirellulales bacterium]|jgi:1-aminocyclopropane-1-carboxylate deaminase/D-cysteine desulfhydrase-like pyridoxal-dependent ACC family enzyme|nr:D-cysteine desulfhydrase family protein [Pirellulales bacterium]
MPGTSLVTTTAEMRRAIERLPRVSLAHLPTPLEHLPRFSAALGGPPIWIKRDDCTGLAFGGNKTRHNEFLLAHALEQGAEMLVWGAGVQSNNCRQTAAACAKLGLACHLMLARGERTDEVQGNLLLDYLLGATVEILDLPLGPELYERITAKAEQMRAEGKCVYSWENEVVKPRAAVSYALCFLEIVEECARRHISPGTLYIASAGSTAAGLLLGRTALGSDVGLRIVAPIRWPWDHAADLAKTANQAADLIGWQPLVEPADVDTTLRYIGPGYGMVSPDGQEAFDLLARTEGILLDPVYTAKALAALVDDVRQNRVPLDRPLVFIHTGGTPALFAYHDELMAGRN